MSTSETVHVIGVPPPDRRVGARETIPHWSNLSRLALGAWTFATPCVAAMIAIASLAVGPEIPPALIAGVVALFAHHAILSLLYAAFAGQNPRLGYSRLAWQLSIVLAGPVTIPVYWVVHVWNAPHVGSRFVDEGTADFGALGPHPAHAIA